MDDDLLILSSQYQAKEQGKYYGGDMAYLNRLFLDKEDKLREEASKSKTKVATKDPSESL